MLLHHLSVLHFSLLVPTELSYSASNPIHLHNMKSDNRMIEGQYHLPSWCGRWSWSGRWSECFEIFWGSGRGHRMGHCRTEGCWNKEEIIFRPLNPSTTYVLSSITTTTKKTLYKVEPNLFVIIPFEVRTNVVRHHESHIMSEKSYFSFWQIWILQILSFKSIYNLPYFIVRKNIIESCMAQFSFPSVFLACGAFMISNFIRITWYRTTNEGGKYLKSVTYGADFDIWMKWSWKFETIL